MQPGPIFATDDDSFGSQDNHNSEQAIETFDLLSVNQLLESVCYYCMLCYFVGVASVILQQGKLKKWYLEENIILKCSTLSSN